LDDGSIMWDGVAIEATTRRRTLESLQQQTQLLSEAQVLAKLGYFDWDLTTGKLIWSDELMRIYGVEPGSFQPTVDDFISRIYPDDRTKVHQTIEQALATGSKFNMEERIVRPSGEIRTLDSHGRVIVNEAGRPVRVVGACQDVTERKQTEAALSQSVSRLKATLESTADGILVVDLEGRMIDFNEQFLTTWKMRPEYIARARETDIVAETRNDKAVQHIFEQLCDPQAFIARVQELYADPTATSFDFLPFKDGRIIERFSRPQLIDGVPVGRVWSFRDVTVRHRAEQALLKSEKEFRTLAEHLPAVITRIDRDLRLTYVNNAVTQLLGQPPSEIIGRKLGEIEALPREFVMARDSEIQQAFNTGEPTRVVHVLPTPRGDMHFDVHYVPERNETGEVVGLLSISVDITARKHLEDQLRQSQKMEAIGRLAGGIAHDFNNLLTVIIGTSEMLSTSLAPQGEAVLNEVNEIREAAQRAAGLTRQLLAFSRQQMLKPVVLDPNEIVCRAESLLRRVIGEDITLVTQLSANLGTISADPGQLEQVLLNLAINSRDAMPQGGNLMITTRQIQESGGESFVEITVTDTGTGIPADVLPRIFDPFFTTKEVGKGTGLGLAVVHGIVEQSGGKIQVRSELGVGTTFSILMPTTKQTPAGAHTPPQVDGRRGKETILVVDDEAAICTIVAHVLGLQGYQVLIAHGAAQAIELVAQHPGNIDLLITDMVMPQMNGELMAQAIRQKLPQLRVVYMSGYYEHESKEKRQPFERMLPKPFTPHDLKAIVRKSLDDI
jgi:PAS domain S-box-containing protein